jgi:hypothetical protein
MVFFYLFMETIKNIIVSTEKYLKVLYGCSNRE